MGNYISRGTSNERGRLTATSDKYSYYYPPRNNSTYFSDHFVMGGERFECTQPEAHLFGENSDLNLLGHIPHNFPYSPPLPNQPIKTLKALINIRRESVRFVKCDSKDISDDQNNQPTIIVSEKPHDVADIEAEVMSTSLATNVSTIFSRVTGGVLGKKGIKNVEEQVHVQPVNPLLSTCYNIEFTFDCDVRCSITIYYFAVEEITSSGVSYISKNEKLNSNTYVFEKGADQHFSQPLHVFNPASVKEAELAFRVFDEEQNFIPFAPYPVVIHCVALEGSIPAQSNSLIASIEKTADHVYYLKPLKQKLFIDGLSYVLQEIYGIEKKALPTSENGATEDELEDDGSECVICMSETRDTLILPCKHLCLCNGCADSLRYQANNCPICRSPFRALLLIKAARKSNNRQNGVTFHIETDHTDAENEPPKSVQTININEAPPGYDPISLIEALNGPFPTHNNDADRSKTITRKKSSTTSSKILAELQNTELISSRQSSMRSERGREKKINLSSSLRNFTKDELDYETGPELASYGIWQERLAQVASGQQSAHSTTSSNSAGQETVRLLDDRPLDTFKGSFKRHQAHERSLPDISELPQGIERSSLNQSLKSVNLPPNYAVLSKKDGKSSSASKMLFLNNDRNEPSVIELKTINTFSPSSSSLREEKKAK